MNNLTILAAEVLAISLSIPAMGFENSDESNLLFSQSDSPVIYMEVTIEILPDIILATLANEYSAYNIDHVYLANNGTYKVTISKDDEERALFFNRQGSLSKNEKLSTRATTTAVE